MFEKNDDIKKKTLSHNQSTPCPVFRRLEKVVEPYVDTFTNLNSLQLYDTMRKFLKMHMYVTLSYEKEQRPKWKAKKELKGVALEFNKMVPTFYLWSFVVCFLPSMTSSGLTSSSPSRPWPGRSLRRELKHGRWRPREGWGTPWRPLARTPQCPWTCHTETYTHATYDYSAQDAGTVSCQILTWSQNMVTHTNYRPCRIFSRRKANKFPPELSLTVMFLPT